MVINNYNYETNSEVCNATVMVKRMKGKGSVGNLTVTSFVTIQKLKLYLRVTLDDNSQLNGNNELVNSVFDIQKVFDGIYSNPIARALWDNLKKSIDFDLKFPLAPVSLTTFDLKHAI